jgi:hypothetical protein
MPRKIVLANYRCPHLPFLLTHLEILGAGSGEIASGIVGDVSKYLRPKKAAVKAGFFAYSRIAWVMICLQMGL